MTSPMNKAPKVAARAISQAPINALSGDIIVVACLGYISSPVIFTSYARC